MKDNHQRLNALEEEVSAVAIRKRQSGEGSQDEGEAVSAISAPEGNSRRAKAASAEPTRNVSEMIRKHLSSRRGVLL